MNPAYLSPIANHLWQSTAFAGVATLLTLSLRNNRARVRHCVWLVASWKFLIPFSVFVSLGDQIHWRSAPQTTQSSLSVVMDQVTQPFTPATAPAQLPPGLPVASPIPLLMWAIWACGFLGISCSWWIRWRRIRAVVRAGAPFHLEIPIRAVSSPALLEPGVFGVFRPVMLVPEGIRDQLTAEQLKGIIAHELCHVYHRDNLMAAIHMFVETVFWFHPLVWWIGKRMVEERERACDEEALKLGSEPRVYAEGILNVCKLCVESPLACGSGVMGGNLKRRIEVIMANRVAAHLTLSRRLLLVFAAIGSVAAPVLFGVLNAPPARAQTQSSLPQFDVASVKPFKPGSAPENRKLTASHGSVSIRQQNLRDLIAWAYGVKVQRIKGPAWLDSEEYDIDAKATESANQDRLKLMLQGLLAQRFKLALHHAAEQGQVYALIVGSGGPKLHAVDREPSRGGRFGLDDGFFNKQMVTNMALLAEQLPMFLDDTPVLDKTGLTGVYEFTLRVEMDLETYKSKMPEAGQVFDGFGMVSGVFESVKELGLKLVPEKGPVDILVIDHIQKPDPN